MQSQTKNQTLATVLGHTTHVSPLLKKIEKLIGNENTASCLKQLAVNRGCRHYENTFTPPTNFPRAINTISNEEAGIALCMGHLHYDPMNIRVGAELLSSKKCHPDKIIKLAIQERCKAVVGYIAKCGKKIEPENSTWQRIVTSLEPIPKTPEGTLPHWSRFVSHTGITPVGNTKIHWLRPNPLYEQSRTHTI